MPYKDKEEQKRFMKEYHKKNREKLSEYNKEWYKNNREKELENNKKWCEENPEYGRKYRRENKENEKKRHKEYYEENKEKMLEIGRVWLKTENGKASNQRRQSKTRAGEREIINTLTAEEWLDILKQHDFKCAYCGKDLFDLFTKPERDHVIPINKGGNNTKENILPSCRSCNAKKHNKLSYKEA